VSERYETPGGNPPGSVPVGEKPSRSALAEHVAECTSCASGDVPLARIEAALAASSPSIDSLALARTAFERARAVLAAQAARAYRRRVAAVLAAALLPLPAVLAYQAYLVRNAYALLCDLLPSGLAAYLVIGYAASLLLVFAGTYAAIPLLCARSDTGRRDDMARALG
jgi:hypothetical protein